MQKIRLKYILEFVIFFFLSLEASAVDKQEFNELIENDNKSQMFWSYLPEDLKLYIKLSLKHNPRIQQDYHAWQAMKEKYDFAKSLPDPMISIGYLFEPIETKTGPQRSQIMLSQKVPWFGVLKTKGSIAIAEAKKVHKQLIANLYVLVKDIKFAYLECAYLDKKFSLIAKNKKLLERLESIVNRKLQTGGKQSDLLKLQIAIERLGQQMKTTTKKLKNSKSNLIALIGEGSVGGMKHPVLSKRTLKLSDIDQESDYWSSYIIQNNPNLNIKKQNIAIAEEKIKYSKLQRRPKFNFGLKYFLTEKGSVKQSNAGDDPYGVSVGLSMPIWSKKYNSISNTAYYEKERYRYAYKDYKLKLQDKWYVIKNNLIDLNEIIKLYGEKILPKSNQIIEVDIISYSANKISIQELIDDIREFLTYEDLYWLNIKKWENEMAKLEMLSGGGIYEISE